MLRPLPHASCLRLIIGVVIRLLHTADWHLGATLQGWSREREHRSALAQFIAAAKANAVHGVIIAGDIFDSLNPSADAQRLLYDTLREVRRACPKATIIMIAGNHDPAGRLEAPRAIFDFARINSIGVISRTQEAFDVKAHLCPIFDDDGGLAAHVLALPYPRAGDLRLNAPSAEGSPVAQGVRALYQEAIAAARECIGAGPLIVTGHLHIIGAIESEGAERRILIGGEHATPSDIFPSDLAYVALGHLHRPQSVGRETIRYSGSLIPMSKTELAYDHGVSLVEINPDSGAHIAHLPFERAIAHLKLPERGALPFSELEEALAQLCHPFHAGPIETAPFLHLALSTQGPATGLKAAVDAMVEKYAVRLVSLTVTRPDSELRQAPAPQRLSDIAPEELFRRAFIQTHGVAPTAAHVAFFDQLAQER